jgi:hypothetical protein
MTALYYVYAHTKPDSTVFYIGKGTRGRAWSTHGRNTRWQRTVAKHGHKVLLLAEGLTQEQAVDEEAQIIAHFKPFGNLVNILDRGDVSPTCNPEVAAKVSIAASVWQRGRKLSEAHRKNVALNNPWRGKKRPEHSALMRSKGLFAGEKNPFFGQGESQRGAANHMATAITGTHALHGEKRWDTLRAAADELGVTLQAISQAIRKQARSKGWSFRKVA